MPVLTRSTFADAGSTEPSGMVLTADSPVDQPEIWSHVLANLAADAHVSHGASAQLALQMLKIPQVCRGWRDGYTMQEWRDVCVHLWPSTRYVTLVDCRRLFMQRCSRYPVTIDISCDEDPCPDYHYPVTDPVLVQLNTEGDALKDALVADMEATPARYAVGSQHVTSQPLSDSLIDELVCLFDICVDGQSLLSQAINGARAQRAFKVMPPGGPFHYVPQMRNSKTAPYLEADGASSRWGCGWEFEADLSDTWHLAGRLTACCAILNPATGKLMKLIDNIGTEQLSFNGGCVDGPDHAKASKHAVAGAPKMFFGGEDENGLTNRLQMYFDGHHGGCSYPYLSMLATEDAPGKVRISLAFAMSIEGSAGRYGPRCMRQMLHAHGMIAKEESSDD